MNEPAKTAIEAATNSIVLFLLLMVVAYFAITILVYKTPALSRLSRGAKGTIVKISAVVVFCLLGYYFSVASYT